MERVHQCGPINHCAVDLDRWLKDFSGMLVQVLTGWLKTQLDQLRQLVAPVAADGTAAVCTDAPATFFLLQVVPSFFYYHLLFYRLTEFGGGLLVPQCLLGLLVFL